MKRMILTLLSTLSISAANPVSGDIAVKILDVPPSVFSFEPIWVAFEVRNGGATPVVIPADFCRGEGASIQLSRGLEHWDTQIVAHCQNHRLVRLLPGQRWLFFEHVWLGPAGSYDVEAVMRSPGACTGILIGPEQVHMEPIHVPEYGAWRFECWEGEAQSQSVSVDVHKPTSDVDLAAERALKLDRIKSAKQVLILRQAELLRRFPTSHYTYAAYGAYAGADPRSMLNVIILQPDNPLNPWAAGAMAARLLSVTRPCASPERPRINAPPDLAERYERVIAAYAPPPAVQEYLRQMEIVYAVEECPSRATEGDEGEP